MSIQEEIKAAYERIDEFKTALCHVKRCLEFGEDDPAFRDQCLDVIDIVLDDSVVSA